MTDSKRLWVKATRLNDVPAQTHDEVEAILHSTDAPTTSRS